MTIIMSFEFVWICSDILNYVLDIVVLRTVRFCVIGIEKLAGIHC